MLKVVLSCRVPLAHFVLDIDAGFQSRVTAIFGPSGSGKTSLLDTIAGLRKIVSGEIDIGGRKLFSSSSGVNLAPRQRSVGYVPQEAALFPHLSVRKNILFGSARRENPNPLSSADLHHVAELLEISHLLERSVGNLSGGESQRVALARALLSRPQLLLLDEPLASLDIGLKERILPYLRRVRDEFAIPMIYVTHNPAEVLALADWVLLLRGGRMITQGEPHEVLGSRFALSSTEEGGVENVFDTRLLESAAETGTSRVRLESGRELVIPFLQRPPGALVQIKINGDDILVATKALEAVSAGNIFSGRIERVDILDGQALLRVNTGEGFIIRLTALSAARLELSAGKAVFLIIRARSCRVL